LLVELSPERSEWGLWNINKNEHSKAKFVSRIIPRRFALGIMTLAENERSEAGYKYENTTFK
jgi:hypothetical protein